MQTFGSASTGRAIKTLHGAAARNATEAWFGREPIAAGGGRRAAGKWVLANILRTDMPMHRPMPADTELARAIAVMARAQQDATWNRQPISNQLHSLLREYYPAAHNAFALWQNGLCRPEARELLRLAPTPARAARLTRSQITAALKRAGRSRKLDTETERLREVFRGVYAHQPQLVEDASASRCSPSFTSSTPPARPPTNSPGTVEDLFPQHPDAEILLSFPGLGVQLAARVLAEVGDDRARFADARGLKAYAGAAPVTRASGKKSHVGRRMVRNNRLNHVGYLWAFSALRTSPGAGAHYRARREHGDWHAAGCPPTVPTPWPLSTRGGTRPGTCAGRPPTTPSKPRPRAAPSTPPRASPTCPRRPPGGCSPSTPPTPPSTGDAVPGWESVS